MATILSDNFSYIGNKPNFQRDIVEDIINLKNANPNHYTNGNIVYCKKNKKYYTFNLEYKNKDTGHFELFDFINKNIGPTENRPPLIKGTYIGYEYYDTTINQKIYWNGEKWENSDGTLVDRVVVL